MTFLWYFSDILLNW